MRIDGPITSEALDSSGEILHLDGLDITDFLEGKAFLNFEHNNDTAENILGRFVHAKKIYKKEDCENDRQRLFWDQLKTPFLYGVCELFDDDGHPGAIAAAAMLRYFKNRNEKVMIGFSIEGATLERKEKELLRTVGRKCAFTLRPCNRQCWIDVLDQAPGLAKYETTLGSGRGVEVDSAILDDVYRGDVVQDLIKAASELHKTLTAGNYNVAPSQLTQGSALQVEHLVGRPTTNRMKAKYRDWDRKRPLKEWLKAELGDVPETYIDHFADVVDDLALKKGLPKLDRISASQHVYGVKPDEKQSSLVEGLYMDPAAKAFKPDHDLFSSRIIKLQNDAGGHVLVKPSTTRGSMDGTESQTAHNATAYHNMARDFFGMGKHVPTTVHFKHPTHGLHQAMEFVGGAKTLFNDGAEQAIDNGRANGDLHKLYLMDMILGGNGDRHSGNVLVHPEGHLMHIDNDQAFDYHDNGMPDYLDRAGDDHLHIDAQKWLAGLNPKQLAFHMKQNGIGPSDTMKAVRRLNMMQDPAVRTKNLNEMHEHVTNNGVPVVNLDEE